MALAEHTTKVFDSDLQELSRTIAEMGGLAEKQIAEANDARQRSRAADNCCGRDD
jgi:phosphate transport system protein